MCTSIAAGKQATTDGTILLARNEEYEVNNWNKYMKYRKSPQYKKDDKKWVLGNGLEVEVPSKSYSYCSIPDARGSKEAAFSVGDNFYFEERGINECNVAISATNSMDINEKAKKADPLADIGIEESILLTLILPQAATAREAVELLGNYLKRFGASEGNGILIADLEEAWYFEIGSCHHWIAVKIPENAYLVIANSMRVHSVDLDDKERVIHSEGLFEFVSKHNLLDNPIKKQFNFAKAFGCIGSMVNDQYNPFYNVDRIWLAQKLLTPSLKQKSRLEEYPLFLEPDKKIEITDIMGLLRANYKGTELEDIATRAIGVVRTAESHIMTIDSKMPDGLKGVIWQAVSSPLGSPYMPIFAVTDNIPDCYMLGESEYSADSAYWSFRSLFSLAEKCEISILNNLWCQYETQFAKEHRQIKNMLIEIWKDNKDTAINFAKNYSSGILCQMTEIADKKLSELLTDIAKT